ncbi:hypothetical protein [Phyllobacterium phragmitis]|uniref:DUF1488 domain-containing protein n=1 Tax=Phyllobacterium phragmitis TaxID=2670329 RepID=A0ABQ0GX06_9HYPH
MQPEKLKQREMREATMQDFEIRIVPATGGPDAHIEGYTVEFYEEGGACVAVTLHDLFGTDFHSGNLTERTDVLIDRAKALMREVLEATGEQASRKPLQPEGPPISSSQSEPELDDAPTVRVKGEGMIRPG